MRVATCAATLAAATFWLGACGGSSAAPPTDLSLSENAVAAALIARVNGPDAPEMAVRPAGDGSAVAGCRDSYHVERVTVGDRPAYGELGSRFKVDASFQVTRLAPTGGEAASLADCFGADPNDPPQDWKQGTVARLHGEGEITWQDGYRLLHIGDQFIPLAPAPASGR